MNLLLSRFYLTQELNCSLRARSLPYSGGTCLQPALSPIWSTLLVLIECREGLYLSPSSSVRSKSFRNLIQMVFNCNFRIPFAQSGQSLEGFRWVRTFVCFIFGVVGCVCSVLHGVSRKFTDSEGDQWNPARLPITMLAGGRFRILWGCR